MKNSIKPVSAPRSKSISLSKETLRALTVRTAIRTGDGGDGGKGGDRPTGKLNK